MQVKLLILINVRWWNATAFYAINIARILHGAGHKVFVGCNKFYPAYKVAQSFGLNVIHLNFYGFNFFELLKSFIKMVKLIKKENIQIINAHRSEDQTFAMLAKLITQVKFVITRGDKRKILNNIFSKIKYSLADAIILTSKSIYNKNINIFSNKHIRVIYGSVDEEHFKLTKSKQATANKYKINLKTKVVGIAGRLDYVKDQYTFIKAAGLVHKIFRNVTFIVTGKQEHIKYEELKKLSFEYKIEKELVILPEINDIADVINLFDIAVITSIDSETISRILLEYLYLKKPVIGTDVNVIPEIIKEGYNGEIIKSGDYENLSEKIIKLLKNKKLQEKYGKNSYSLYKRFYCEKVFYNQYIKVLRSIL